MTDLSSTWSAVARAEDAAPGEVIPVRLLDAELAIWRAASDRLEAWDDRCPHRGTRLTLGTNAGEELVCRYHGWRFAAGSARCTFVPATPTRTPPRSAIARAYRCVERYGLVWVSSHGTGDVPPIHLLEGAPSFTMRSVAFDAGAGATERALADAHGAERLSGAMMAASLPSAAAPLSLIYVLHAQTAARTTIHGIVRSAAHGTQRIEILRTLNERMKALRRRVQP